MEGRDPNASFTQDQRRSPRRSPGRSPRRQQKTINEALKEDDALLTQTSSDKHAKGLNKLRAVAKTVLAANTIESTVPKTTQPEQPIPEAVDQVKEVEEPKVFDPRVVEPAKVTLQAEDGPKQEDGLKQEEKKAEE
jgi:hypothetical protein